MKLQSMVSFVLEQVNTTDYNPANKWKTCLTYAKFLSQPLNLGMFIPCGEDGQPMKPYVKTESEQISDNLNNCRLLSKEECAYQKAVNRVLFEGFELRCPNAITNGAISITFTKSGGILLDWWRKDHTENIGTIVRIECLTDFALTLTPTAVNQLKK